MSKGSGITRGTVGGTSVLPASLTERLVKLWHGDSLPGHPGRAGRRVQLGLATVASVTQAVDSWPSGGVRQRDRIFA